MTIFKSNPEFKPLITHRLEGSETIVAYFNGKVITAALMGQVTIMNESLQTVEEFEFGTNGPASISACDEFLVIGDWGGDVRYYERNAESKVIQMPVKLTLRRAT